jgi:hypothetical protein
MYSDNAFSTHAGPTLKSLEQSELFTSLMQMDEGNIRSVSRNQSHSPRDKPQSENGGEPAW